MFLRTSYSVSPRCVIRLCAAQRVQFDGTHSIRDGLLGIVSFGVSFYPRAERLGMLLMSVRSRNVLRFHLIDLMIQPF